LYNLVGVYTVQYCGYTCSSSANVHVHVCLIRPLFFLRSRRGVIVIGFTTTYAIGAYHPWLCEFESRSGWGAQHYV